MLSVRYPTENVTIQSEGGRNIQVVGIDERASSEYGCTVLKTVWSAKDKPIESEEDKIRRQRDDLTRQLAKMREEEKKAKEKAEKEAKKKATAKKRRKRNASTTKQVVNGTVPTGKRGRPRKMVEDTEFVKALAEDNGLDTLFKAMDKSE